MSANETTIELSPADRRREIGAVLARGLSRWRQRARAGGFMPAPESLPERQNCLELSDEKRLSVADRTAR